MKLLLRVFLLLAVVRFATQAVIGYAFDFRTHGYPLWPLLGLGGAFAGYLKLRPSRGPKTEISYANIDSAFLLLILALVSSAFLLDKRGEDPLTPTYFIHLCTLTLFLLLLPFIVSCLFGKARTFVTAVSTLVLMAFLVDGTMKDPEPVISYFTEARAYDTTVFPLPEGPGPIPIIPPDLPPPATIPGKAVGSGLPENDSQ